MRKIIFSNYCFFNAITYIKEKEMQLIVPLNNKKKNYITCRFYTTLFDFNTTQLNVS